MVVTETSLEFQHSLTHPSFECQQHLSTPLFRHVGDHPAIFLTFIFNARLPELRRTKPNQFRDIPGLFCLSNLTFRNLFCSCFMFLFSFIMAFIDSSPLCSEQYHWLTFNHCCPSPKTDMPSMCAANSKHHCARPHARPRHVKFMHTTRDASSASVTLIFSPSASRHPRWTFLLFFSQVNSAHHHHQRPPQHNYATLQ